MLRLVKYIFVWIVLAVAFAALIGFVIIPPIEVISGLGVLYGFVTAMGLYVLYTRNDYL